MDDAGTERCVYEKSSRVSSQSHPFSLCVCLLLKRKPPRKSVQGLCTCISFMFSAVRHAQSHYRRPGVLRKIPQKKYWSLTQSELRRLDPDMPLERRTFYPFSTNGDERRKLLSSLLTGGVLCALMITLPRALLQVILKKEGVPVRSCCMLKIQISEK